MATNINLSLNLFIVILTLQCHRIYSAPKNTIIGGGLAGDGEIPYQVSVQVNGLHVCGGAIVSADFILTAAHCIDFLPQNISILAGSTDLGSGGNRCEIKRIIKHEEFLTYKNDIALLELTKSLVFNRLIQPINLSALEVIPGSIVRISGWSRISNSGPISNFLKFDFVTTMSDTECSRTSTHNYKGLLCLAHSVGSGSCNEDAGGPAVYEDKLIGIANFIVVSCGSSYPDGYAKISHYYNWIKNNMNEESIAMI